MDDEVTRRPTPDAQDRAAIRAGGGDVSRLQLAVRRARVDEAERSDVIAELRGAEIARLEMLLDALAPTLAELPPDADLFDVAITPGPRPRLFIDMIGFVEMSRDRRVYRFLQDTRHGRTTLAESERIETMAGAVTDYIARRLVEREKALASDATPDRAAPAARRTAGRPIAAAETPMPRRSIWAAAFGFVVDLLGSAVLIGLVGVGLWQGYRALETWLGWR